MLAAVSGQQRQQSPGDTRGRVSLAWGGQGGGVSGGPGSVLSAQPHPTHCRRATGAQGDMGDEGMPSSMLLQTLAGLAWFPW